MKKQIAKGKRFASLTRLTSLSFIFSGILLNSPVTYSQIGGGFLGGVGVTQSHDEELRRLRIQLDDLQRQASSLSREMSDLDMRVDNLRRDLDRTQNDLRNSQRSLDQAQNDLRRLNDQIIQLQRQVQEAQQRKAQQISQLTANLNQVRSQVSGIQSRLQQAESVVAQSESQRNPGRISAIMNEIGALKAKRDPLEASQKDYAARIAKMEAECNSPECMIVLITLRNNKKSIDDQINAIDQEYLRKLPELNALQEIEKQHPAKVAERDRLRGELNSINSSIASLEANLRNVQAQPIPEEAQLAQAQSRVASAQSQVSQWQRSVDDLSRRSQQQDRDLRELQSRRDNVSRQLSSVQMQIQDVQRRIDQLNSMPNRIVLAGSLLSSSQRAEIQRSNAVLLSVESSSTPGSLRDSRAEDIVLLMDSVDLSRLQWGVLSTLEQIVKSGGTVTILGSIDSLVTVSEADRLLSMCQPTVRTAVGLKTVCH